MSSAVTKETTDSQVAAKSARIIWTVLTPILLITGFNAILHSLYSPLTVDDMKLSNGETLSKAELSGLIPIALLLVCFLSIGISECSRAHIMHANDYPHPIGAPLNFEGLQFIRRLLGWGAVLIGPCMAIYLFFDFLGMNVHRGTEQIITNWYQHFFWWLRHEVDSSLGELWLNAPRESVINDKAEITEHGITYGWWLPWIGVVVTGTALWRAFLASKLMWKLRKEESSSKA